MWYFVVSKQETWIPPKDLNTPDVNIVYDQSTIYQYLIIFYYGALSTFGCDFYPMTNTELGVCLVIVTFGIII